MYNDPSGEFWVAGFFLTYLAPVIWGAVVGTLISVGMYAIQALVMNSWSWNGFANALLMGAVTGGVSAGLGQVFSASGFWGTVGNGALAGAGSGGVTALITGQNFLEGVLKGAVIGGGVAAVNYTMNYFVKYAGMKDQFKYYSGEDLTQSDNSLEYSSETLKKMRNDNFTSTEIREFKVGKDLIGSEKYSQTSNGFFNTGNGNAYAYTTRPAFFSGTSNIHYAKAAFASKELLFTTMVHETGHAYIMNAGNFFVQQYDKMKLFNRGYGTTINDLGHAAIFDMENYLSKINGFNYNPGIGTDKSFIMNAVNNNITGDNTQGFNFLKRFLLPVFNRKMK
ncbi:hypothetical protein [Chryseobacterium sp. PMSZPI]|uniref:hypothetical protein n=1 Tax=Chryseobacterium sp. PMSZPI TaxID=1033900 RepID=UPI000C336674|nr:hypothetical protein [Chryseobacterium sp. PMSZPI]PKF75335.1 hypothetical protein CW752_05120 [Chryseobacterium sp. PMSZPI]